MTSRQLFAAIGLVDEDLILQAAAKPRRPGRVLRRALPLAACSLPGDKSRTAISTITSSATAASTMVLTRFFFGFGAAATAPSAACFLRKPMVFIPFPACGRKKIAVPTVAQPAGTLYQQIVNIL